jgi:hypothetical protein
MPENAVYVGRPTRWGNPYRVSEMPLGKCLEMYELWLSAQLKSNPGFLDPLMDKDLACFCRLDSPCHADILLRKLKEIDIEKAEILIKTYRWEENHNGL